MKISNLFKKAIVMLLVLSCVVSLVMSGSGVVMAADKAKTTDAVLNETESNISVDNANFSFMIDKNTGGIFLTDKRNGQVWKSIPDNAENDEVATGKFRTDLKSVFKISYLNTEKNTLETANTATGCLTTDSNTGADVMNIKYKAQGNSITANYVFADIKIAVPVKFTLDDEGLTCTILVSQIIEAGINKIKTIILLPYFGAAGLDESGYLFIPDGSGTLAYFNMGKESYNSYHEQVYARDESFDILTDSDRKQNVLMPVFGINKVNSGLFGVITEGDALAYINASVNGQNSQYSQICPEFTVRSTYYYTMGEGGGTRLLETVTRHEEKDLVANANNDTKYSLGDFTVKYYPLNTGSCDYNAMADVYKKYLMNKEKLSINKEKAVVHVELPAAVRTFNSFLGMKIYKSESLNTVESVEKIVNSLMEKGVDNIDIKYTQWSNQQLKGNVENKANISGVIGGRSKLNKFIDKYSDKNVNVYLDTNFYQADKFQSSYTDRKYSARNVTGKAVTKNDYELETFLRDKSKRAANIFSPAKMIKPVNSFLKSFKKFDSANISISGISNLLASDFDEKGWSRQNSMEAVRQVLEALSKDKATMMKGGNIYSLKYADSIIDAPKGSSNLNIADADVPFYQMVISGIAGYSYSVINGCANTHELLLKSIETGADLHFCFITENYNKLTKYSDYFQYTGSNPNDWYETVGKYYSELQAVNKATEGTPIASHAVLSDGVRITTWENGCSVIVNYNSEPFVYNGRTVEASGYIIEGGEG